MKTNYDEQLAWFQQTVQPSIVTPVSESTRCWHATRSKPTKPYEPPPLRRRKREEIQKTTKRNSRVHQDKEMQASCEEEPLSPTSKLGARPSGQSTVTTTTTTTTTIEERLIIEFEAEELWPHADCNNHTKLLSKACVSDKNEEPLLRIARSNSILRTMSEETVYYDAQDHLDITLDIPTFNTTHITEDATVQQSAKRVDDPDELMKQAFKRLSCQRGYLPNQKEAMCAAVEECDILLVMPLGFMRNICYILPATLQPSDDRKRSTIIIVPTYAYLVEQEESHLPNSLDLPITFVTKYKAVKKNWISRRQFKQYATMTRVQKKGTDGATLPLLYMTFEDISSCKSSIDELYQRGEIARFVIDQAQCLSQWCSNEFHLSYLRATQTLRDQFPTVPITALTHVYNERIHMSIMSNLKMKPTSKIYKKSILL